MLWKPPTTTAQDGPRASMAMPSRDVARPVANLGNTCYMNAVLQALAHAPELCMAMDCEPHRLHCPIAMENTQKRRLSPSSSPDNTTTTTNDNNNHHRRSGHRKSRRSGKRSPSSEENGNGDKFCSLCSVEEHLEQVHSKRDDPVAPETFVHGFIDHVAPWFKLGVQEDSHEFLRLLIDAMQKSCHYARSSSSSTSSTTLNTQGHHQHYHHQQQQQQQHGRDGAAGIPLSSSRRHDDEYPFSLFRGTVESNVTCDSCRHSSSTMDPIEDIGLEVTPILQSSSSASNPMMAGLSLPNHTHTNVSSASSSLTIAAAAAGTTSTSSSPHAALADVSCAFQRFARVEDLDAGYKCEKCGKVGRATKQSRLASIPPILTLHLKRFRYGETAKPTSASSGAARRTGRNEVSQLLGSAAGDYYTGKSGSAKIEGHVKFEEIFDLYPYLTLGLQAKHSNMMCRLFAVIVHSGKSSHSGHYIAYVRNHSKNEWWKMDDARVMLVTKEEVMNAEAYMLFYRVVEHPIAVQLRMRHAALVAKQKVPVTMATVVTTLSSSPLEDAISLLAAEATIATSSNKNNKEDVIAVTTPATTAATIVPCTRTLRSKRKAPHPNVEEWARAKTRLPPHIVGLLARAQEYVSDTFDLKVEFSELLRAQANRDATSSDYDKCALEVCEDDLKVGSDKLRHAQLELFFKLIRQLEKEGGDPNMLFDIRKQIVVVPEKKFMVPLVEADDTYL